MFNRSWCGQVELPVANRTFDSSENAASLNWSQLGDIRLKAVYTGSSEDMSSGWSWGRAKIAPIAQMVGSGRGRDNGSAAALDDSGYQRILVAPGLEVDLHPVRIYADVELPVYQNLRGNQLVAPVLFKLSVSYMF